MQPDDNGLYRLGLAWVLEQGGNLAADVGPPPGVPDPVRPPPPPNAGEN